MKKLLVAAMGIAAAYGAFADPTPITALRFESANVGDTNSVSQLDALHEGSYWSDTGSADNTYVIESAGAVTSPKPLGNVTKALNVKTKFGNPLSVNVADGGEPQTIGVDGIYFDSLVKFTVCDDCPTNEYSGAKIVMWLQEDEDLHKTNLYVNAGFLSCDNQGRVVVSNAIYKCGTTIGPDFADAWHRVTIKAIANITTSTSTSVPGFAIFIDGSGANATKAECTSAKWDTSFTDVFEFAEAVELLKANSLFPSLIQGASGASLSKASFDGTGSITDIAFYDASPDTFADDYVAPKAVITVNDEPYGSETGEYTDLAGAIAVLNSIAAAEAAEVKFTLQRDVAFDGDLTINNLDEDVTIIIDLAGKELTVDNLAFKSPVTITDSSDGRTGVIIGDIYVDREDAAGEMTLLAGTIDGYIDGTYEEEVAVYKESVFLTGGTVKQNDIDPVDGYVLEQVGETDFYNVVEYVAPTYTVTFDSNGGSAVASAQVTEGDTVARPADPTREDYRFAGWTLSGSPYDFDTAVTAAITLVAQWEKDWASVLGAAAVGGAYEIDNLAELKKFQANVGTLATAGVTFKLTANITLDAPWPGIGIQNGKDLVTSAKQSDVDAFDAGAFQGTFDGQNHTISGFQIIGKGDNAEGLDYAGFFNSTLGATIQNFKIQYAGSLFAADTTSGTKESGATFVGVAKNSTLRNLTTVAGTVSCSKGFGGIVGYLYGTTVDSCTNNVNMTSLANNKCGGIAMICQKADCSISNCENNGTMTTTSGEHGGIVGYTDTITINNCKNTAACKMFYHHSGTVTLQGVNTGNATVQSYTGNATPGLKFATVDGNVATFVADDALALNGEYKVMATNVTATFAFAEAGTIAFDQALFTPTNYAITAAQGLTLTDATSGTVKTYTAAASGPSVEPIDPDKGGTAEYADAATATAAADAINADKANLIAVDSSVTGEAKTTYLSKVQAVANGTTVTIQFTTAAETEVQTQVNQDAAALPLATIAAAAGSTDATVPATPGCYYTVKSGTAPGSLTAGTPVLATGTTVTLPIPNKGTAGFYKIEVKPTK